MNRHKFPYDAKYPLNIHQSSHEKRHSFPTGIRYSFTPKIIVYTEGYKNISKLHEANYFFLCLPTKNENKRKK